MSSQRKAPTVTEKIAKTPIQKDKKIKKSPLVAAILENNTKLVQQLLIDKNKLNFETKDSTMTPFDYACQTGNTEIVELLFNNGYHKIQAERKNKTEPLHLALKNGHIQVVKFLIANGFKKNLSIEAIHLLIRKYILDDRLDIVKCLIGPNDAAGINEDDSKSETLLHCAATHGRLEILRYLIECGADVRAKTDYNEIPLHYAIRAGHVDIVRELVLNVKLEESAYDFLFNSLAVHIAAKSGNEEIFKILLDAGYPTTDYFKSKAPIHVAAECGHWKLINMLLKTGIDVNFKLKRDQTPLHFAVASAQLTVVQFLLQAGAHPINPNEYCDYALHLILRKDKWTSRIPLNLMIERQVEVLKCLLNHFSEDELERCLHSDISFAIRWNTPAELVSVLLEYNGKRKYDTKCCSGGNQKSYTTLVSDIVRVKILIELLDSALNNARYEKDQEANKFFCEILVARIIIFNSISPDCDVEKKLKSKKQYGLDNHYEECQKQMMSMRKTKIHEESDVTFYDVLAKPVDKVANYLKCKQLVVNLESSYNKFPAYAALLEKRVENGKERVALIDASVNILFTAIQEQFKIQLPNVVIVNIFEYLEAVHLRKLVAAYFDPDFSTVLGKE